MKALTVTQPWASLIRCGAKRIETRSWKTEYRGPLAIHAAQRYPGAAKLLAREEPGFWAALDYHGMSWDTLPTGAHIAVANLVACLPTEQVRFELSPLERLFGTYDDGRYAFILEDVQPIDPVPERGALSLWTPKELG